MIAVREAAKSDIPALYDLYALIGKKDDGYFDEAFTRCDIYLAISKKEICGFCLLNWSPRYAFYKRLDIPEIQDINVVPAHRRRGVATALIAHCETLAREKGREMMGISVGLSKDYGPAQILYAKLGYIPDGNGVTYDRGAVRPEKSYAIDDDLALMLVKTLGV